MIALSQETETLAQRVASATHMDVDHAVRAALEDMAKAHGVALPSIRPRDLSAEAVEARRRKVEEIVQAVATLPVLDPRPISQIIDELNEL